MDVPVLHLEQHLADLGIALRVAVGQWAADHAPDDPVLADRFAPAVQRLDRAAVAQHGDRVGDLGDLVELVGDQDRGNAALLELQQQVQQGVAVALVQAGGRLVQDQQLHFLGQRLGDLHQLLLADADIGDQGRRRFAQSYHPQQVAGPQRHGGPVDHAVFRLLVAEEDVFGDGQQRHQRQFLVDDDDAGLLAVRDAGEAPFLALEPDLAGVGAVRIDAAQDLHQRRFAGPVLAHQRMDLAAFHAQIDVLERIDARKRLGDPPHFKDRSHRAPYIAFDVREDGSDALPQAQSCQRNSLSL